MGSFGLLQANAEKDAADDLVNRLLADLRAGADQLELDRQRTASAHQALGRLIDDLTRSHSDAARTEHEVLQDFLTAARAGYYDFLLDHDSSYQQLRASGRMALIRDAELTGTLIDYYQQVDHIKSLWSSTPPVVMQRFQRLTGAPAIGLIDAGELHDDLRHQLMAALHDPQVLGDLRELNAMLSVMVMNEMFQTALTTNRTLLLQLEALVN